MVKNEGIFNEPIGVQAYSFRHFFPKDMIGTLNTIQEMGITLIEGDGGRIPPEEFKKLCEAREISIPSTGSSYSELKQSPQLLADKAKALGASYVMCAWIPHEGDFNLASADEAIMVFNKAGQVLAENGIQFTYHPHGYEFGEHPSGVLLDHLISSTNPEYVNFEMDIYWIHHGGGNPVEWLKKYPNRWKLMHLKDMKIGTQKNAKGHSDVENNVVLGQGELDMHAILRTAKEVGVKYYFIEDESSSVINQVPLSIAYLRSLSKEK